MLSEQLFRFIRNNLQSVWALEILLIMCRDAGRSWTPDELNRELRGSIDLVHAVVMKFEQAGLVKREADERFRWAPSSPELNDMAQELVSKYPTHSLSVIKTIIGAPSDQIQSLADAFKIRKD